MKKLFIIAAAAVMAFAACSKSEMTGSDREITFQVANRLQTKATGVIYENGAFGTYAWFKGTTDFMVNEQVNLIGGVWKTADHTFYWPKTGSLDFISYSPFTGTSDVASTVPAVTSNSITYTGYTVGTTDLMYADKVSVVCENGASTDEINDGVDSGYKGVPTIFRHALAKLSFKIKASFLEFTDPTTNTTTKWEVTVKSAKIGGFKTKGDCALTLNTDGKTWDKPLTQVANPAYDSTDPSSVEFFDYYVWKNLSGTTADQELVDATAHPTGIVLTTTAQDLAAANGFVMPQVLSADAQKLKLDIHIKTTLSNNKVIEEDFTPTIDIMEISSLKAWQMNQNIVYTINIKPVAYVSDYDTPNDVIITFDPAVADWTNVDAAATIQI